MGTRALSVLPEPLKGDEVSFTGTKVVMVFRGLKSDAESAGGQDELGVVCLADLLLKADA